MSLLTLVYRALCSVLTNVGTSIRNLCLINVLQNRVGLWYLAQQKKSDLSASTSVIKSKTKKMLLDEQKQGCEITC